MHEARQAVMEVAAEYAEYDHSEYEDHYQSDYYEPNHEPADLAGPS
jgi:hypothetical protein